MFVLGCIVCGSGFGVVMFEVGGVGGGWVFVGLFCVVFIWFLGF